MSPRDKQTTLPKTLLLLSCTIMAVQTQAAEVSTREAYAFYIENDSRKIGGPGSDQAYTNGFKFSYIYAEDRIPTWSKELVDWSNILDKKTNSAQVNYGLSLGQQIFTPTNTQTSTLVVDERPYAAWLSVGLGVSLKEPTTEHFLELGIGAIGPCALGEEVQNTFHKGINTGKAQGWSNSLRNEPTLQLFYQKRTKTF